MRTVVAKYGKRLLIVPLVAVGILGFMLLQRSRKEPTLRPPDERGVPVRVVAAQDCDVVPRAVSYGTVRPTRTWKAVAQVGGRVVKMPEQVRVGAFVAQGALLFEIDSTEYEIEVARSQQLVETVQAQLNELSVQARQYEATLALERRSLDLARRELTRLESLLASRGASESERDVQARAALDIEGRSLQLEQSIELVPSRRKTLETQLAAEGRRLERARLDVARCRIVAPLSGRVSQLDVEEAQVATAGQMLAALDAIDSVEVAAPFGFVDLRPLRGTQEPIDAATLLNESQFDKVLPVDVSVRLDIPRGDVVWEGRLARFETMIPETRTLPVVVVVDDPYENIIAGERPPLGKGMYVQVELRGRKTFRRIVVPRAAIRTDGRVPVATEGDRLELREVDIDFTQGDIAVLVSGIDAGERVIVSDLLPAVDGMLLRAIPDDGAVERLLAAARGEGDVR